MDLQPLLVALMSENNDIRTQAEKSLNEEWLLKASDTLLLQLAAQSRVAESETVAIDIRSDIRYGRLQWCCYAGWLLRHSKARTIQKPFGVELERLLNNKSEQRYWRDMKR